MSHAAYFGAETDMDKTHRPDYSKGNWHPEICPSEFTCGFPAYKTLVRSSLDYACTVWDPYSQTQIHQVEMVQRRAARFVTKRYHNTSSVTDMLADLKWEKLTERSSDDVQDCPLPDCHPHKPLIYNQYKWQPDTTITRISCSRVLLCH